MRCSDRNGKLMNFVAGRLPAREMAEVRSHLAACPSCARLADEQRSLWSALDGWHAPGVSVGFNRELYLRLAAAPQPWYQRWFAFASANVAAPVAAAAALGAAVFFYAPQPAPDASSTTTIQRPADMEGIERTLDDMDMLRQLGVVGTSASAPPTL